MSFTDCTSTYNPSKRMAARDFLAVVARGNHRHGERGGVEAAPETSEDIRVRPANFYQ